MAIAPKKPDPPAPPASPPPKPAEEKGSQEPVVRPAGPDDVVHAWIWNGPRAASLVQMKMSDLSAASGDDGFAQELVPGTVLKIGNPDAWSSEWANYPGVDEAQKAWRDEAVAEQKKGEQKKKSEAAKD